jgi:DNA polymerase
MRRVVIEPTFDSWRAAARPLLAEGVPPPDVVWDSADDEQSALLTLAEDPVSTKRSANPPPGGEGRTADSSTVRPSGEGGAAGAREHRVPRRFIELAESAACHADAERWALLLASSRLLYQSLWERS